MADYYTIAQVVGEPDEWEHEDYGWFNSFTLQFEGVEGVVQLNKKQASPEPEVGEVLYGNITPSGGDFPPKFKTEKDPAKKSGGGGGKSSGGARRSSGGGGGKGGYSPEDLRAIRRNEAQGKAVQWLIFKALAKQTPQGTGKDGEFMLTVDFLGEGGLVDLFVQDVLRAEKGPAKATTSPEQPPIPTTTDSPPPEPRPSENPDGDDDIPF